MIEILKNKKAFSFMEAMVVIIIIGICVLIWGFYGRKHTKVAMMTEARMFIEKIVGQEKVYYGDNGFFYENSTRMSRCDDLFINTDQNKYFKSFRLIRPTNAAGLKTFSTVLIDVYPDTTKYPDLNGYSIRGVYLADKDLISYDESYGS